MPSTAGQKQAVDRVTRPDMENDQRKSTPFISRFFDRKNIIGQSLLGTRAPSRLFRLSLTKGSGWQSPLFLHPPGLASANSI